ncbi:MAG TPA: DUF4424 family protein [Beijerinckiaceae bacterium]|nr:DUF4424 family protein [Beijerinckiaceae bacterium]
MNALRTLWSTITVVALVAAVPAARANDSMAATAIGGLTLVKSDAIRMDSEDLYISEKQVRVAYRFTNTTDRDIDTLVAFPLPDYVAAPTQVVLDFANDIRFETRIDGKPAKLDFVQQAIFKGQDITARLTALGVPPVAQYHIFEAALKALPKSEVDRLVQDGLLQNIGAPDQPDWLAKWLVRTTVTRTQVFPAGKTVSVEHSYNPLPGGSVGGGLDRRYRKEPDFAAKKKAYCIDDAFIRGFEARQKTLREPNAYSEVWLAYVLKTGANWAGPIRDFRLVVDKGDPDALVSFCAAGVKKTGPTTFEVRAKDFTPKQDLNVLIVKFEKP